MSQKPTDRNQKILALQAAIAGNTEPLKLLRSSRGRLYTAEELERRQQYLSELLNRPASQEETIRILGRFDKSGMGKVCIEYAKDIYVWH